MRDRSLPLLDIWREVGRHDWIAETVDRCTPLLAEQIAFETLMLRHVELARRQIVTAGIGGAGKPPPAAWQRSLLQASELESLLSWLDRGEPVYGAEDAVQSALPWLVPEGSAGELLVGPLGYRKNQPLGAILLARAEPFAPQDAELLRALLEPFTVALDNDCRMRELHALREAAEADNRSLLSRLGRHDISESVIGADTGLKPVMDEVQRVATSDVPVLILGETGSGKEVVAREIHSRSPRRQGPFLRVNCGAIPPELIDSELFGHERGSFTGAVGARRGWFERADGGTLFLDECGELSLAAQVRLLRILQDGSLERVGSEKTLQVDVRIVAATHRDLRAMADEGRFRADLWYRLAVFPIQLPPLRERVEDIPALAGHFATRAARRLGMPPLLVTEEAVRLLVSYSWPGNVRELAAVIERAALLGDGRSLAIERALGTVPARPVPAVVPSRAVEPPPRLLSLDAAMSRHIEAVLAQTRGRIEGADGAAAALGINPHTLRARMRKLGIDWSRFRDPVRGRAA